MAETKLIPNKKLRYERIGRGWSQEELAEIVGTTPLNVGRWERGATLPGPYFRRKLCAVFEKTLQELGLLPENAATDATTTGSVHAPAGSLTQDAPMSLWNVPYNRNLLFTGREDILTHLHHTFLHGEHTVALSQPYALSGLGGVGKTQTAIEYAYRYRDVYHAVLWARADSVDLLTSDFLLLAVLLNLPQRSEQDQSIVVKAVRGWFDTHDQWLFILDNADDLATINEFLPSAGKGHVLITSRANSTGTVAGRIEIETMGQEEGTLFLLRRAKLLRGNTASLEIVSDGLRSQAQAIVQLVDGLPLALDQAGAYVEETGCTLNDYLKFYKARRGRLLRTRGSDASGHPEPVATTWSLSIEKVEQANPAAAEMLRLCAFLHPDEIPEAMLVEGASALGSILQFAAEDELELNEAIAELRRYSLVKRDPDLKFLNIHRLVQAVIKDAMDEETKRMWVERIVRMINTGLIEQPSSVTDTTAWSKYQRYLPHVQLCAEMITQWHVNSLEAGNLLNKVGCYLSECGRYDDAAQLILSALAIRRQQLGEMHLDVAQSLNSLAEAYDTHGEYAEAEPLYQQALVIREQLLGPLHIEVAHSLGNLAWLYREVGKYAQAELYARRAIRICEEIQETALPELAICLNSLGAIYFAQGKYAEAEPIFQRVLTIREQILTEEQPEFASSLNNLATVYRCLAKYEESEQLLRRALAINERIGGLHHPDVAYNLHNLAEVYNLQARYEEAEPLLLRSLAIRQQVLSPQHPGIGTSLNALGKLYANMSRFSEAESLFQQALAFRERVLGPEHPDVAVTLKLYTDLLRKTGREAEAVIFDHRAQAIQQKQVI